MRFRIHLDFDVLMIEQCAGLFGEFVDRLLAGAGHRLISRHVDARDSNRILDRLERNQHLHGRTIRIGNDAAILVLRNGVRIHLRHDQRDIAVIAEVRSIVDYHATGCSGQRRVLFRHAATCRKQTDLCLGKIETFHVDDGKVFSFKAHR